PLFPFAVELGVEDLLPWAEIEFATGNRQHDLMPHDRPLQMRVCIVFASLMVAVVQTGGRQLLEPLLKVVDESILPVVHVNAGGNVHRRHQYRAVTYSAFGDDRSDVVGDSDELLTLFRVEPEIVGVYEHVNIANQ